MVIHVINKVSSGLKFLYHQNRFLNFPLSRLLCNAMIQPFFDYARNAWYPNANKKLKMRLQAAQNKCIRFCLKLNARSSIKTKDFEKIRSMKEYHNVLYTVYTNFLLRIFPTILMRYVFL